MIPAETRYKTHNGELLAIVEAFKTWRHYLKGCKHEVLVLIDYNNLRQFMDTKSLSSRQVRWLKNSFVTTFESIIIRARQTELQTRCFTSLRGIKPKKTSYKPKILGFFINCSPH